jgi:hypothetical protein
LPGLFSQWGLTAWRVLLGEQPDGHQVAELRLSGESYQFAEHEPGNAAGPGSMGASSRLRSPAQPKTAALGSPQNCRNFSGLLFLFDNTSAKPERRPPNQRNARKCVIIQLAAQKPAFPMLVWRVLQ